jgi:hypothetical protein
VQDHLSVGKPLKSSRRTISRPQQKLVDKQLSIPVSETTTNNSSCNVTCIQSSVVDPHHVDADPDSTYHPDADPDSDFLFDADPDPTFHPDANPDPTFHPDADPDPDSDPSFKKKAQNP